MLKIAICDDNVSISTEVEQIISEYAKEKELKFDISVFNKGENMIKFIKREHNFDLIFLDIELGTTTGVEIGTIIRQELCDHISKIVFISGADGYEMELFNLQPLNFLRKPIGKEKVHKCIDLTLKLLDNQNFTFTYKKGSDILNIPIQDILYFEKQGRKIGISTLNFEDTFNSSISKIKNKLPEKFICPHESFIVNFSMIKSLSKDFLVLVNNKEIPISRRNLSSIRKMLINMEQEK
ncbi:MAG: LytTR family DNA-binding domain-containing protein [Clostridia bacterium]